MTKTGMTGRDEGGGGGRVVVLGGLGGLAGGLFSSDSDSDGARDSDSESGGPAHGGGSFWHSISFPLSCFISSPCLRSFSSYLFVSNLKIVSGVVISDVISDNCEVIRKCGC